MGDPVSMTMAAVSMGGKGLSIAGKLSEGQAQKTASQVRGIQLKMAAEAGRVRADQADAAYREELTSALSNITAIRAAQGMTDSPTGQAIYEKAESLSNRARRTAVGNEKLKALGLEGDAASAFASSQNAMTAAWLKAAPDILSLGQSAVSAGQTAMK
jgi:hypothetical protein